MLRFFDEITKIPRPSHKEEKINKYLVGFAKKRGLKYISDEAMNVIIKKPGTKGRENEAPIILQSHMDMVCEKLPSRKIDFEKEGIRYYVEGDNLKADGTTLGADDGIGMAMMLTLLDSKALTHPPLECIFTSDEEVGMIGVNSLDVSVLDGKTMINLDTEEEGYFITGCAGGSIVTVSFLAKKESVDRCTYEIKVGGLLGGHSGADIDKNRGNANIILFEALSTIRNKEEISVSQIVGGRRDNAIPRDAKAIIGFSKEIDLSSIEAVLKEITEKYKKSEPDIFISVNAIENEDEFYSVEDSSKLLGLMEKLPNGVIGYCKGLNNTVETSLSLGVIRPNHSGFDIVYHTRSSKEEEHAKLKNEIKSIVNKENDKGIFSVDISKEYTAWEQRLPSKILERAKESYIKLYEKEPIITVIHAGLECGIFADKIKGLDVISIGPDITGAHSPDETLSVSSAIRTFELLIDMLNREL